MSLNNEGMSPADYAAISGNNGWGGDGAWWLLVLFLFAFNGGGWGNGFGGGAAPYMVNNDVQRGFDQSALMNGLNGLTAAVSNGFANAELSRANSNMNLIETLNGMTLAQQQCCCDNRAALADLKYTVATEGCADRQAVTDALTAVTTAMNTGFQSVHDKLCQQEIDTLKTQNENLRTQINMANLQASQTAQTAQLIADNTAQTMVLEQRLNPTPIPAYVVANPNAPATT